MNLSGMHRGNGGLICTQTCRLTNSRGSFQADVLPFQIRDIQMHATVPVTRKKAEIGKKAMYYITDPLGRRQSSCYTIDSAKKVVGSRE